MASKTFGSKADAGPSTPAPASVENGDLKREAAPTGSTPDSTVAVRQDSTVGSALPPSAGFDGSWDRKDIRLPRLNLIHKTSKGESIEKFGIGSFSFNQEVKLSDGKKPIVLTVFRAAKDYQQKLPFGSDIDPATFPTPEAVEAAGYSLNYADVKSGKFCGPRAHIQIITALPEGASEEDAALFPYEFNGVAYGMAMFTVASSAFTSVGKELATLFNNNKVMRKGLLYGRLELTSETRQKGDLDWKVPVIKYVGENSAELVAFYQSLL